MPRPQLDNIPVTYAYFRYLLARVIYRIKRGRDRRNKYFRDHEISYLTFLPELPIQKNGIKAIVRKNTNDFEYLFQSEREREIQPHILDLRESETFVDVGSYIGYYTIKAATMYGNKISVVAIEANPRNIQALKNNIKCNKFKNVSVINKAASNYSGITTVVDAAAHSNVLNMKENVEIECDTLDTILKGRDRFVLKVDVEGYETEVLQGASRTLEKTRKIITEIHSDEKLIECMKILEKYFDNVYTLDLPKETYATPYLVAERNVDY